MREKFIYNDALSGFEWSPDDNFIMGIILKKNQIVVKCLNPQVLESNKEGW